MQPVASARAVLNERPRDPESFKLVTCSIVPVEQRLRDFPSGPFNVRPSEIGREKFWREHGFEDAPAAVQRERFPLHFAQGDGAQLGVCGHS